MNQEQLNFVMDKLKIRTLFKRFALYDVITKGETCYAAEKKYNIPKNTLNRSVKKCNDKWQELIADYRRMGVLTF